MQGADTYILSWKFAIMFAGLEEAIKPAANGEPMTTFDKREEGFEKKFAHDEELKFKAEARRNKLLGLWAAEKLGITGPAADAYAKEVVVADFDSPGDSDVLAKVQKDFEAKQVAITPAEIRRKMDELIGVAIAEIKKSG
jgi:hypothetical protein